MSDHPLCGLDEYHLSTETVHDLGQLDSGGSAAQHEQAARNGLHARRLPGAPDALEFPQARNGRHGRISARRHDDVPGRMANAVHLDYAHAGELALAASSSIPLSVSQVTWPESE